MIEIIVGAWLLGFLLSVPVVSWSFYITRKHLSSEANLILNQNLNKIGLYWSNVSADFVELSPGAIEQDAKKTLMNSWRVGILGFLGMPGFFFLVIVVVSVNILAKSRKEKAVFESLLAKDKNLNLEQIKDLVQKISALH